MVRVQVEDERRTRREPGRRGKGATWDLSGRKKRNGTRSVVGKGRAEGERERSGRRGGDRRAESSQALRQIS